MIFNCDWLPEGLAELELYLRAYRYFGRSDIRR